jgi:hypothetical protein
MLVVQAYGPVREVGGVFGTTSTIRFSEPRTRDPVLGELLGSPLRGRGRNRVVCGWSRDDRPLEWN